MKDSFNREIDYMRISITDRCNLRCSYCMPQGINLCSHNDIMSFDEIENVCRQAVKLGIINFKITGGEPLIRRNCSQLIKNIYAIEGVKEVTLTTNGVLLEENLDALIEAGLTSVNVSLDTLDRKSYREITGFDELEKVLSSIDKALEKGLRVKINAVMHKEDFKEDFFSLINLAKEKELDIRFIEMMPIGEGAKSKLVSNETLLKLLEENFDSIKRDYTKRGNGPAKYFKIKDLKGRIGFISAIHGKFCNDCNRIRMTSKGDIKACLCFEKSQNIREAAKKNDENSILKILEENILSKPEKHLFEQDHNITEMRKMIQIGG